MRRFLALVVLLLLAGSFLLPQAASALLPVALRAEGLRGESLVASVAAWPPQEVLLGRATTVTLQATGLQYAPVSAAAATITIEDVDLLARRTGAVQATLEGATLNGAPLGPVTVAGPSLDRLTFQTVVPRSTLEQELARAVGGAVTIAALEPPNTVELRIGPLVARPQVSVNPDGRSLDVSAGGLPVTVSILALDSSAPIRISHVSVVPTGLMVSGTIQIAQLSLRPA